MTRFTLGLSLGLILALASLAEAKTVSIDFTGASSVSNGLTQVNNAQTKDGATVIAKKTDKNGVSKNVAMTGNTDANRYLYLAIDPAFKQGLKSVWLTVEYFDEGTKGTDDFQVQYDANADAHTQANSPATRKKFDTTE